MKLKLNPTIVICNSEKLTEKSSFLVETCRLEAFYSETLYISIENEVEDDEAYVSIELNKNQALYLMQILSAFVKEKHLK